MGLQIKTMGLQLAWDNTALLLSPNVIAVRAWQRQKVLGGTFYTTGFIPANDLAPSIVSTEFVAAVPNKVYEFKVESICESGGPTENDNGLQEGIVFECLDLDEIPVFDADVAFSGSIDLTGTDIEGVIFTLKLQADDSIIEGPDDIPEAGGSSQIDYTGLEPDTAYYIEAVLYATVNGIQVAYNCGGNISGFQFTTEPAP